MFNVKFVLDDLHRQLTEKADLIQRDLIEPLDLYHKHYQSTNTELIKQGTHFWNNLHQDRTQMLFAKENYHNQLYQMQQMQMQYSEVALNAFGNGSSPEKRTSRTSANMMNSDDAHIGIQDKKL